MFCDWLSTIGLQAEELDKKLRHIVEDVPDRVYHTMSSIAGASSSDFHTYRHSRRREQDRLRKMEEDHKREELNKKFQVRIITRILAVALTSPVEHTARHSRSECYQRLHLEKHSA